MSAGRQMPALAPPGGEHDAGDDQREPDDQVPLADRRDGQLLAADVERRDPCQPDDQAAEYQRHQPGRAHLGLRRAWRRGVDRLLPDTGLGHDVLLVSSARQARDLDRKRSRSDLWPVRPAAARARAPGQAAAQVTSWNSATGWASWTDSGSATATASRALRRG